MKAIVLTAGEGAHFFPLTVTRPKGMSIVAGKPILQHTVEALAHAGVKDVWFVVGYKPERVRAFFGNGQNFGVTAHYVTQERPEGTGAAVRLAATELQPDADTLVVFGDNHYTPELIRATNTIPGDVVLGTGAADPRRNGLLVAKNLRLAKYEYPSTSERGLVNTGLMKFTPAFFQFLAQQKGSAGAQLPHALQAYVDAGNTVHVATADRGWDEADSVWDLLRMNERLLDERPGPKPVVLPGVRVEGNVTIGPNTRIEPGAHLIGPLYIGSDCEVRENAIVGPYVSLRNSVHVGSHTEIRHAIVNSNVFIDSQCVVRFSILDDGVELGPFAVLAEGDVATEALPTRRGAVVGPDSHVGARATVRPGSVLGPEQVVADGQIVGDLEARPRAV